MERSLHAVYTRRLTAEHVRVRISFSVFSLRHSYDSGKCLETLELSELLLKKMDPGLGPALQGSFANFTCLPQLHRRRLCLRRLDIEPRCL